MARSLDAAGPTINYGILGGKVRVRIYNADDIPEISEALQAIELGLATLGVEVEGVEK